MGAAEAEPTPTPVYDITPLALPTETPEPRRTPTPSENEDPAVAALRELQNQDTPDNSLIGGVKSSRPSSSAPLLIPTVTPAQSPTPTPALPRVGGQATGYTMLYLMHPRARLTVERQIEAMLEANLEENYLGVLADGTFSLDFPYLENVVRRLNTDGRSLLLVLYFSNGSAMRNYDTTESNKVPFNLAPPDAFRLLIQYDAATRAQFQTMVSRALPVFQLNRSLNPRNGNIAIVMLEDNLDSESYREMRDLMRAVVGPHASITRNPCPGCAPGNDADPQGDALETHSPEAIETLGIRDGFSLDGTGYELSGDAPGEQTPLERVRQLKTFALSQGIRYFGLWRKQRQGLGTTLINPDERDYEIPTDAQLQQEVELLRWGLDVLSPTPEPTPEEEDNFFN